MALYLIRHGETADNRRRVLQMPDSVLSDTGEMQAHKLANRLKDLSVDLILSSDYERTKQTTHALNQFHSAKIIYEPLLRERHFGDWRGKHYDEVGTDRLNDELAPPNGEDKSTFFARVEKAWHSIQQQIAKSESNVLIVSHGLFCQALVQNQLPLAEGLCFPKKWLNTSVTIIEQQPDWVVTKVNCTEHLSEEDLAGANLAGSV